MLLAALAVTATLLLIVRHGPPDNPDMSGSAAANSSSTGGGDADGIVPCDLFGPAAVFERLSHFKDAGVPGTSGPTPTDAFNRAAIADGSCRMVGTEGDVALAFLHPRRADAVVAALAALPSTSQPSLFTRTAVSSLPDTCRGPPGNETVGLESFGVTAVAGSLQNWFRALCDPNWDDPAYMPQQQLLTFGFSCMVTCDVQGTVLPGSRLAGYGRSAEAVQRHVESLCKATTWAGPTDPNLAGVTEWAGLKPATEPWAKPCGCAGDTARGEAIGEGAVGFTAR